MFTDIPLAWLQLTREPSRLLSAVAGVAFAVLLVFMQFGFSDALYASAVRLHASLNGELFLISPKTLNLVRTTPFSRRRLYQVRAFEGVESVSPVYASLASWQSPYDSSSRSIFVVGVNPSESVFNLPGVDGNRRLIRFPDVVLFDEASRPEYGPVARDMKSSKTITFDLGQLRVSTKRKTMRVEESNRDV